MSAKNIKAEAWRRAANLLERDFGPAHDSELTAHVLDAVVPSLRRRAEIIERRDTWAKRRKEPRT